MEIELRIPAVPVAQPRARAVSVGGHARMYGGPMKSPVNAFKATVRTKFEESYKGPPLCGALRVDLIFVFPRPKGLVWKTKAMPRLYHAKRPDRDNLDKSVLDALKGLAWIDDAQVCQGYIEKWIAAGDEAPHVDIRIRELEVGMFNGEPKYKTTGS